VYTFAYQDWVANYDQKDRKTKQFEAKLYEKGYKAGRREFKRANSFSRTMSTLSHRLLSKDTVDEDSYDESFDSERSRSNSSHRSGRAKERRPAASRARSDGSEEFFDEEERRSRQGRIRKSEGVLHGSLRSSFDREDSDLGRARPRKEVSPVAGTEKRRSKKVREVGDFSRVDRSRKEAMDEDLDLEERFRALKGDKGYFVEEASEIEEKRGAGERGLGKMGKIQEEDERGSSYSSLERRFSAARYESEEEFRAAQTKPKFNQDRPVKGVPSRLRTDSEYSEDMSLRLKNNSRFDEDMPVRGDSSRLKASSRYSEDMPVGVSLRLKNDSRLDDEMPARGDSSRLKGSSKYSEETGGSSRNGAYMRPTTDEEFRPVSKKAGLEGDMKAGGSSSRINSGFKFSEDMPAVSSLRLKNNSRFDEDMPVRGDSSRLKASSRYSEDMPVGVSLRLKNDSRFDENMPVKGGSFPLQNSQFRGDSPVAGVPKLKSSSRFDEDMPIGYADKGSRPIQRGGLSQSPRNKFRDDSPIAKLNSSSRFGEDVGRTMSFKRPEINDEPYLRPTTDEEFRGVSGNERSFEEDRALQALTRSSRSRRL